ADPENLTDVDTDDAQDKGTEIGHKIKDKDCGETKSNEGGSGKEKVVNSKSKTKGHFCPICVDRRFRGANKLARHMRAHTKEKPFSCPVCAMTFSQSYHMTRHVRNQHSLSNYICSKCGASLRSWEELKSHMRTHVPALMSCPECDKKFKYKSLTALKYHLRTHTEERPYQCTCCIETFTKNEDLERHCLKHRKFKKAKPYSCTRCDYAFSTLTELTEHMSSHKGEQPMNCPDCGKTFLNKNKLQKHLSIHTGERPHLCSLCAKGFPSAASLKLHVLIHTGDKPFKCSQCSKSFSSSSGLRLHGRQHMAVRPSYPFLQKA
uniref:C2H2-type domain-containing protein n=1 Tax=Myripristis murdjan TaxID=586833 RepID=A0A667WQP5_9TELE